MIKTYDQFIKNILKKDPKIINNTKIIKYKNKIKFVFQNVWICISQNSKFIKINIF